MNRLETTAPGKLRDSFDGPVHTPGDPGYDEARRPWMPNHDPHPTLVAEATGAADVAAAIRFAREHDLPLAVQATGHGVVAPADGALLLRTGRMTGAEVDPERRVARVAAGTPWSAVIAAAAPHGLAALSGTSAGVSVTGYTVGGGAGYLSRAYGYAADSVLRAEVVTADGERVTATADAHPDLFWALRGGSGNYGVVTELEFRLLPVERLWGGMAMFEPERAAEALAVYRDWAPDEPDESSTAVMLMDLPPLPMFPEEVRGRRVLGLRAVYLGSAAEAAELYRPLLEACGRPLLDGLGETTFGALASMAPPAPPVPAESHIALLDELPDAVIEAAAQAGAPLSSLEIRHWGGAMARPLEGAGPIGHRDVPYSVLATAMSPDREAAKAAIAAFARAIAPHATGASFLNFLADPSQTASAYTPADYARLAEVKRAYDPDNVFRGNHNIPPAS
jgi:FAD/FMN-containing dehydrogenase